MDDRQFGKIAYSGEGSKVITVPNMCLQLHVAILSRITSVKNQFLIIIYIAIAIWLAVLQLQPN